jgi:hypothetical protein
MSRSSHDRTKAGVEYYAKIDRQRQIQHWRNPIETLLVAMTFMLFVLLAIDRGRVMLVQQAIDNAAYEAARAVMVPGASSHDAIATANELIATAGIPRSTVSVSPRSLTDAHGVVRVQIEVPYDVVTWCLKHLRGSDATISATSTILTERFAPAQRAAIHTLATEHVNDFESPMLRVDEI